jgi:FkbM family methyltransferase
VLDLGANVGFASVALAARYPDAAFVCIEPEDESVELLEANLRINGIDGVVVRAAATGAPGRFEVARGRAPGSDVVVAASAGSVSGLTVSDVLDRAGWDSVDLMKIDIEGDEWGVFADVGAWAGRVRAVIGELHPVSSESAARATEMLAPHGFTRVALPDSLRFRDVCLWVRGSQ